MSCSAIIGGPGIPQEQLEQVMEPFYRVGSRNAETGGYGLGIARGA
ncbi:ATP-binding protein [Pseudomonas poae]|nr:ATP-binding protein [Pseudomonas poae]